MGSRATRIIITVVMSVMLAVTMMPVNAFAETGADTAGFSSLTVKFSYNGGAAYGFEINEINEGEFFLWEILETVQLNVDVNDVTEVRSSNKDLVEPFGNNTTGNLAVRVNDYFDGTELLYVTADGVTYEIAVTCDGEAVPYINEKGETEECHRFTRIAGAVTPVTRLFKGWYVIDQNMKTITRAEVEGDVHLIVCNGVKAEFLRGIHVPYGSSLTIYGQEGQTGELICQPKPQFKYEGDEYECDNAGIGGNSGDKTKKCGDITINGATVTAGGGIHHDAAIGGADAQANGKITINGGTVTANVRYGGHTGEGFAEEVYAAAIGTGGGWNDKKLNNHRLKETPDDITVNGGDVTALCAGKAFGAAIGSGYYITGGPKITINGGVVQAFGSTGAGIGGGERGADVGDIIINNGTVYALSTGKGAGIGGGNDCKGGNVTINGGHVSAVGGGLKKDYYNSIEFYKKTNLPNPALDANSADEAGKWASLLADFILPLFMTGEWGGAGIGGGDDAAGGTVTINGGIVVATAGMNSAQAIGHGDGGSGSAPISLYESAQVTYGKLKDRTIDIINVELYGDPDDRAKRCRDYAYVKIEPGKCSVRFDMQGHGEAPAAQEVMGGQNAEEPDAPKAEGYLFAGWYTEKEFVNRYDFSAPVNKLNLTLYARWVRIRDLTVKKKWPEGAVVPKSLELEYTLLETREYDDLIKSRNVTLSAGKGWSDTISITEECVLEIKEPPIEGYLSGRWVLSGHDAKGNEVSVRLPVNDSGQARLDLQNKEASGLTAEEFNNALEAVRAGNAELTITNVRSKVFSVRKLWGDIYSGNNRPDVIRAVLQKKQKDSSWKTIETVELTEANDWKKDFKAVEDLGAENAANYRIRELDKDGAPVLDKNDGDSDGKDPIATLQGYINGKPTDIDYHVTYEALTDDGLVNITNSAGVVFSAEMKWEDHKGSPDTVIPESVYVGLFTISKDKSLAHIQTKVLNKENDWQTTFSPLVDDGDRYVIREVSANDRTVYDNGELIPVYYYGEVHNKARYTVTEDNKTNEYSYDVTYAADESTRHTTITNKRTGIFFKVRKNWEFPEESKWTDRVGKESVYAVLQRKVKDEAGSVKWETVGDRLELGKTDSWKNSFPAVPLSDEFEADDYRVREQIRHFTPGKGNHPAYWPYITYFETEPDDDTDKYNHHYKTMLASDDSDNTEHEKPVFNAEFEDGDTLERTCFEVSYDRDADCSYIITNSQCKPGPFAIKLIVDNTRRGSASFTVNDSKTRQTKAYAGDSVRVRVSPRGAYSPKVTVKSTEDGSLIEELDLSGKYGAFTGTFEMPGLPVTIFVSFERAGEDADNDPDADRNGDGGVHTGDESYMALWLTVMIMSGLALAVLAIKRKRS